MSDVVTPEEGRICCDCGEWKTAEHFYVQKSRRKDGGPRLSSYCKACFAIRNKVTYAKYAPQRQAGMRDYRSGLRRQVLDHYGAACICCGETEDVFLTVDHVNEDGAEHRRELGTSGGPRFYRDIIRRGFPAEFQIMCFNCNVAKHRLGECPHQTAALNNYSYGRSNF